MSALSTLLRWAVVLEGGAAALILAAIFGHVGVLRARQKWLRPRLARARSELVAALNAPTPPDRLPRITRLAPRHRLALLLELAPSLAGEPRRRLVAMADGLGVPERARRLCRSRRWHRRLRGARLLTALCEHDPALLLRLLRDRERLVRAQAAEWVAVQPDPAVVEALICLLEERERLCRFAAQDALLRVGAGAVEPLARFLGQARGVVAEPALEVAAAVGDPRFVPPALEHAGAAEAGVRRAAAAALGAAGGEKATAALERLLADDEAQVRAAAAAGLGRLGHWPAGPALVERLGDRAWQVRRSAALALRALGDTGELLLRQALRADNPFAADMARQTLDLPSPVARMQLR